MDAGAGRRIVPDGTRCLVCSLLGFKPGSAEGRRRWHGGGSMNWNPKKILENDWSPRSLCLFPTNSKPESGCCGRRTDHPTHPGSACSSFWVQNLRGGENAASTLPDSALAQCGSTIGIQSDGSEFGSRLLVATSLSSHVLRQGTGATIVALNLCPTGDIQEEAEINSDHPTHPIHAG